MENIRAVSFNAIKRLLFTTRGMIDWNAEQKICATKNSYAADRFSRKISLSPFSTFRDITPLFPYAL